MTATPADPQTDRKAWMGLLARAKPARLAALFPICPRMTICARPKSAR